MRRSLSLKLGKMLKLGKIKRGQFRSASLAALLAAASIATPTPGLAQGKQLSVIRDAEIEQLLRDYANPLFKAAKINAGAVKIILIGDKRFNAFVADGQKMFINIGAIMESTTPNQLIGVMAHESGHIAGGHLVRQREALANAQIIAIAGTLLGAGAVVGSATSGGRVGASSGGAIGAILGPQELAQRALLSYQRSEEQAADRAAVNYLNATGQSAKGMLETFRRFADNQLFARSSIDPYLQSHPMPNERISSLEHIAEESPSFNAVDNPALKERHELARAKLIAFTGNFEEMARRYPSTDTSLPARYAQAVSAYKFRRATEAQAQIDGLIRTRPNNPYFWELKGQALLENAQPGAAIAPLRKAVQLAPNQPLIRMLLGHALVQTDTEANAREAIKELTAALARDEDGGDAYRFLGQAYARIGNDGMASLASAQGYFNAGQYAEANRLAKRAQAQLPADSVNWVKADDILNAKPFKKE